jgi:hypothetical protein
MVGELQLAVCEENGRFSTGGSINRELGEHQRGVKLPPDQVERRRATAAAKNLKQYLKTGYHGRWWTPEELALLGRLSDEEVTRRTERTPDAVRQRRERLGILKPLVDP